MGEKFLRFSKNPLGTRKTRKFFDPQTARSEETAMNVVQPNRAGSYFYYERLAFTGRFTAELDFGEFQFSYS
jgi:hypothetical protein